MIKYNVFLLAEWTGRKVLDILKVVLQRENISKECSETEAKELTKTCRMTEYFIRSSETESVSTLVQPEQVEFHTITHVDGISLWPERMLKELIDYCAVKDHEDLPQIDVKSLDAKSAIENVGRKCTPAIFEQRNRNGEVVIRCWLCFHQQMVESTVSFAS